MDALQQMMSYRSYNKTQNFSQTAGQVPTTLITVKEIVSIVFATLNFSHAIISSIAALCT